MGPQSKPLVKPPGPLDFPRNFNPHAVAIWFAACRSLPQDTRSAWTTAIARYRAGCKSAGLSPFVDPKQDTDIAIRNYLFMQRTVFVRAMNVTGLTRDLKVIRLVHRECRVEPYGFSLIVSVQFQMDDPTWIKSLFRLKGGYRFSPARDVHRRYCMELDPGLTVFVYNDSINGPRRWHIGYEIKCPIAPMWSSDGPADAATKEQYVLDNLWAPLMNTYRERRRLDRIRRL